ncbi:alpha/beta-hydrolase [Gonapodya prolifera JEL478]|uniref:Alpha/beta-hydrolase n=1 Tax=Gonapodya prolifera (strain JEL478) TaxID=1344416 RepID=A0A139AB01_GONPJ|nr:alpha/beta-hydrolase [Gonapodya prolifera JEL478]|eukprot:KXS13645.1 alpha/beta-hydrolase [Gonapodya prolifera JEL478]
MHVAPYSTQHHWTRNTVPMAADSEMGWIYWQTWSRAGTGSGTPKADVLFVHGIKDYGGRQPNRGLRRIVDEGYRVHAIDLPGHGRSDGIHALFTMDELVRAVRLVEASIRAEYLDKPESRSSSGKVILWGASLGGLVLFLYTRSLLFSSISSSRQETLLILQAAALIANPEVLPPGWVISVGTYLVTTYPSLAPVPYAEANRGKNTSDPDAQLYFDRDPMAYTGRIRLGAGLALLGAFDQVAAGLGTERGIAVGPKDGDTSADLRVLFLHGDADRVAALSSTTSAYAAGAGAFVADPALASKVRIDAEKVVYTGGVQHDMPSEWTNDRMVSDVIEWMNIRVMKS